MKQTLACVATFVAAIAGGCLAPGAVAQAVATPAKQSPAGVWHGSINRPPIGDIRLELRIEEKAGVYSGVGANMDQGGMTMQLGNITSDGATLKFSVPASGAGYSGKWDAKAKAWVGEWTHPAGNSPATFKAGPTPPK